MTCHQVRQKYPATSAGKAANGSKSFATKIRKATFKVTSGIVSVRQFRGTYRFRYVCPYWGDENRNSRADRDNRTENVRFWAISGHFVNHITSSALRGDGMMSTASVILLY
jgi:hypothetical protein